MKISQIRALTDNYIYVLQAEDSPEVAVVDPSEAEPVLSFLSEKKLTLTHVINTHHHWDHTGGNLELKKATGCRILTSAYDQSRIEGADDALTEISGWSFHGYQARVLDVPGHTLGHIALWFPEALAVFTGDTLFSLGCGRLFEGTAAQMWESLQKLRCLPDETLVYCGHEYTFANALFAEHIDPKNARLIKRREFAEGARPGGKSTVPSFLGEEKACNPFLRADAPEISQHVLGRHAEPLEVFTEIRRQKDHFR